MEINPIIEATDDGSHTLRHPIIGDTYHSKFGALTESEHIFIQNGFDLCQKKDTLHILEVGFGTGLNALLTLKAANKNSQNVDYVAVELYPVSIETARHLCYSQDDNFLKLHEIEWGKKHAVSPFMTLTKIEEDFTNTTLLQKFDLVYFDAFAPESQPDLWTEDIFRMIFERMGNGGLLVTYSAKGDVKRALRSAGFTVKRVAGPPGKRHMLQAIKHDL